MKSVPGATSSAGDDTVSKHCEHPRGVGGRHDREDPSVGAIDNDDGCATTTLGRNRHDPSGRPHRQRTDGNSSSTDAATGHTAAPESGRAGRSSRADRRTSNGSNGAVSRAIDRSARSHSRDAPGRAAGAARMGAHHLPQRTIRLHRCWHAHQSARREQVAGRAGSPDTRHPVRWRPVVRQPECRVRRDHPRGVAATGVQRRTA